MAVPFVAGPAPDALPVWLACEGKIDVSRAPEWAKAWVRATGWTAKPGEVLAVPGRNGQLCGAFLGRPEGPQAALGYGALATRLPPGEWRLADDVADPELAALGYALGAYRFERYRKPGKPLPLLVLPDGADRTRVSALAEAVTLARDLINTPANDMGPADLEAAARTLAERHGATISVTSDDALEHGFPMIHAVGRAATVAPRLIDLTWGPADARKVTLVGKGVCFDSGGLDIKPASGMLLMKKDMGGAANVLSLASLVMTLGVNVRLRVLIPAVENAIAGNAFRPGDILRSRSGQTVEIGNTDAEGRLILADALSLADEEAPDLLVDMATLTGAARVALGPDLPPFYTDDDGFAAELSAASVRRCDPLWRMPLWQPYRANMASKVADMNNVTNDGFAGSVTAALFLQKFVTKAAVWSHLDIFGWVPVARPHAPVGGEAQGIRALLDVIAARA